MRTLKRYLRTLKTYGQMTEKVDLSERIEKTPTVFLELFSLREKSRLKTFLSATLSLFLSQRCQPRCTPWKPPKSSLKIIESVQKAANWILIPSKD